MRVSSSKARRKSNKRLFKEAKGRVGGRRKLIRQLQETTIRARKYAFGHRRLKKRDFRKLWIIRLNAACQERGMRYSEFIHAVEATGIELNRKMLSELAIHDPTVFDEIVSAVKA